MLYYFFFWCFCPLSFSLFPNTFQFYLQSQSNDNSLNSVKCFRKRTVMLFYYLHLIIVNKLLPLHNVVVGNWKRSTQQTDLTSFGRWQIEFNLANAFSPVSYYCLFFFFFVLFSVFFFLYHGFSMLRSSSITERIEKQNQNQKRQIIFITVIRSC